MSSGGFRHNSPSVVVFCWPFFDRLQLACISRFYHAKNSRPAGHEKPLLSPTATTIIQIQVIAIQKRSLRRFYTRQIMV